MYKAELNYPRVKDCESAPQWSMEQMAPVILHSTIIMSSLYLTCLAQNRQEAWSIAKGHVANADLYAVVIRARSSAWPDPRLGQSKFDSVDWRLVVDGPPGLA